MRAAKLTSTNWPRGLTIIFYLHYAVVNVLLDLYISKSVTVAIAEGKHPFPFRTRQLSPPALMILRGRPRGKVGRRRDICLKGVSQRFISLLDAFFVSGIIIQTTSYGKRLETYLTSQAHKTRILKSPKP